MDSLEVTIVWTDILHTLLAVSSCKVVVSCVPAVCCGLITFTFLLITVVLQQFVLLSHCHTFVGATHTMQIY